MPIRPPDLKLYTNSRSSTYRRCAHKHWLQYDQGYRAVDESEALRFGALGHEALESWLVEHIADDAVRDEHWRRIWRRRGHAIDQHEAAEWERDPLGCALDAIDAASADPFMKARARAAIRGYHDKWSAAMSRYRVLAVELEFIVPFVNPASGRVSRTWALAGKVDGLVFDTEAQVIAPLEHKFTGKDITEGSRYWKRLRMDPQLSQYIRGARSLDQVTVDSEATAIDRAVYDVIRRPDHRPSKATAEAERKYTQPKVKACPECKKHGPLAAREDHHVVSFENDEGVYQCDLDDQGKRVVVVERAHLYANQRERDESPAEFEQRVYEEIQADVGRYYVRDTVMRTEEELRLHEHDSWTIAKMMHAGATSGGAYAPRNVDACDGELGACEFLDVCYFGLDQLKDPSQFRRVENVHEELSQITEPPMGAAGHANEEDQDHADAE